MFELFPEKLFHEAGVADLVGVGETIAEWSAQAVAHKNTGLHTQPVADIIETYRPGQLGEEHGRQMAHDAEGSRPGVYAGFPRDFPDHPPGNELEKLVKDDIIGSGRWLFCSHTPTEWQGFKPGASPLSTQIQEFLWDACVEDSRIFRPNGDFLRDSEPCMPNDVRH